VSDSLSLRLDNVSKRYRLYSKESDRFVELFFGGTRHKIFYANEKISFELYRGETLGIIGMNGAGKSTLLKMIAGVLDPSEGTIERHGRVTALLELGTGFNHDLTGRENIHFNGMLLGMDRREIQRKIDAIIQYSELGSFIDEPLRTYSSGMMMRLAFSIAIHTEPDILIVDEALSVGDAHFSAKCTRTLKELKEKRMSILYVSHDLNSLKLLCDRLLLLDRGHIVAEGDPERVVNRYNRLLADLDDHQELACTTLEPVQGYGAMEARIVDVEVRGKRSQGKRLSSGEEAEIRVLIESDRLREDLTLGIMIRDRFGQDIFGTVSFVYWLYG